MYPIDQHRLSNAPQLVVGPVWLDHGKRVQNEPMFVADLEPTNKNIILVSIWRTLFKVKGFLRQNRAMWWNGNDESFSVHFHDKPETRLWSNLDIDYCLESALWYHHNTMDPYQLANIDHIFHGLSQSNGLTWQLLENYFPNTFARNRRVLNATAPEWQWILVANCGPENKIKMI